MVGTAGLEPRNTNVRLLHALPIKLRSHKLPVNPIAQIYATYA